MHMIGTANCSSQSTVLECDAETRPIVGINLQLANAHAARGALVHIGTANSLLASRTRGQRSADV